MIAIDRKIKNCILNITQDYNQVICYKNKSSDFVIEVNAVDANKHFPISVDPAEVENSLKRLNAMNLISFCDSYRPDVACFSITPELLHRKAFLFDSLSKRFLFGFVSGVAVTIAGQAIIGLFN